jgi:hypothetical protein
VLLQRKGGKCYDWHSSDLKHDELVARVKAPTIVLLDPTEKDSPELLSKGQEGNIQFVSWAYPHLCFQSGEAVNLKKAAKRLLFVRMCDGTPYSFFFDCDRTKPRELRQMGELKIQFTVRCPSAVFSLSKFFFFLESRWEGRRGASGCRCNHYCQRRRCVARSTSPI